MGNKYRVFISEGEGRRWSCCVDILEGVPEVACLDGKFLLFRWRELLTQFYWQVWKYREMLKKNGELARGCGDGSEGIGYKKYAPV